jgi:tetratricopeptide (TPR) repeat protein
MQSQPVRVTLGAFGLSRLSAHNPRLRHRVLAGSGLAVFILGFFVVAGYGRFVLLAFLGVLALAALAAVAILVGRRQLSLSRVGKRAASAAATWAGTAASISASAGREARGHARRAVPTRPRRASLDRRRALRLNARGAELRRGGDYSAAVDSHRAALEILGQAGDRRGEALTLNSLALAFASAGLEEAALASLDEALSILRELNDRERQGQVVANLGFVHMRGGRRQEATECLRAALESLRPESQEYRRVEAELRRAS